jgi:hypothetical protein
MASEPACLPVPPEDVKLKGRLQPGKMLLVDTVVEGRIVPDEELKRALYGRKPYQWLKENQITLDQLARAAARARNRSRPPLCSRQRAFGYTDEDLKMILGPWREKGEEPIGSMGADTPAGVPLRQAAAAVPLLQAALRAGHQSAHRPHPRRDGDVADQLHRHRAQHPGRDAAALPHAEAAASHPDQPRPGKAAPRQQGDFLATTLPMLFRWRKAPRAWSGRSTQLCRRASLAINPATRC